jgi:hypothetical protein
MISRHDIIATFTSNLWEEIESGRSVQEEMQLWFVAYLLEIANGKRADEFVTFMQNMSGDIPEAIFSPRLSLLLIDLVNDLRECDGPAPEVRIDDVPVNVKTSKEETPPAPTPVKAEPPPVPPPKPTPIVEAKKQKPKKQPAPARPEPVDEEDDAETEDDSGRTYLGEIRRAISTAKEPFTKKQVLAAVLAENPKWDEDWLNTNVHSGFGYLERSEKIHRDPAQDGNQPGEVLWLRSDTFTVGPNSEARNHCPIIEPATGNKWDSVADLAKETPAIPPSRIYRAIAAGIPLDDGRLIRYVKGHGQRKVGQPPVADSPDAASITDAPPSDEAKKLIGGGPDDWQKFPGGNRKAVAGVRSDPFPRVAG